MIWMNSQSFEQAIEEAALEYAKSVIMDADEHEDAVAATIEDYLAGAQKTYELLTR